MLAADHENDPDKIGAKAVSLAQRYLDAIDDGDETKIKLLDALILQVEGKPLEVVHRTDNQVRTIVVRPGATEPPEMP